MRTPTLAALFGGLFAVGAAVAEPAKTELTDKLASGKPADVVVQLTFAPRRAGALDSVQGGSASGASGVFGDAGSGSATQAAPGGMTGLGLGSGGGTIGIGRIGTVSQSSGTG